MNEIIDLMRSHSSVRRFTEEPIAEKDLRVILEAGRSASTWKNFSSYSIVVVRSAEKKEALFQLMPQEAIRQADTVLVFVGDHYRASQAAKLHQASFDAKGPENLLISSVDAALAGQNTLLAAESLGYGGVFIGLIRDVSSQVAELFALPDYTYPVFCIALGHPNQHHPVKPRMPFEAMVFEESYQKQGVDLIEQFDQIQTDYAGSRQKELWSERVAKQFQGPEQPETRRLLEKHQLM